MFRGWTRCPKGVFRNRGKMEENRYSLVAGKLRVERAKRGRKGASETPPVERGRFVRTHTEAHAYTHVCPHTLTYTYASVKYTHTRVYTQIRTTLRLGLGKTIPGKTPKIRRYETT